MSSAPSVVPAAAALPVDPTAPVFIVMNAGSGHDDAAAARKIIEQALHDAGREYRFALVDDPARLRKLAEDTVSEAQIHGGIVVAAGGDGTINAVANATYPTDCPFAVLPRGTFNFFSRTHGIPADTAEAVNVLLTSRAHPVQVGLVNGRVFLVNASLGLYPQVLEDREAYKQQLGRNRWVALVSGLMTVLRHHRELTLDIEHAGASQHVRTPTLFVGNNQLQLERIGIQEAPALEHNRLVALMLRPVSVLEMLWLVARGAFGTLGDADQVISFAFDRITVRPRRRKRYVKVATDGEILLLEPPIEFKVGPKPLFLLKPDPHAHAEQPS
jgi:diacylglycerol kinase family enzyme